jgi:hypothetical protein
MREQFYHSCKQYGITVSGCHGEQVPHGSGWEPGPCCFPAPSSSVGGKGFPLSLLPSVPPLGQCHLSPIFG